MSKGMSTELHEAFGEVEKQLHHYKKCKDAVVDTKSLRLILDTLKRCLESPEAKKELKDCDECEGDGFLQDDSGQEECPYCDGTGIDFETE